jgi:serine protease inhibitor
VPNNGNIPALVNVITPDLIDNSIVRALKKTYIDLSLPRFKMMSNYSLIPYMKGLGANKMFKVGADLSAIAGKKDLFVSDIVHRTLIGLNEEGTEAFSATAGEEESLVSGFDEKEPLEVKVNQPFMYIIRDNTNSVILFIGVITNL